MILSNTAVKNRTTVLVLVVAIVVAGVYSYVTLPREAAPDVAIPYILISTTYEGVSPQDIETSVTMEIEKELTGLKGLKEVRSTSAEGTSLIVVEFDPGIAIDEALQRVKDKVDLAKADMPEEVEEPVVKDINIAEFPIMIVNISGTISAVRIKAIADELEDAIEQVPGVLSVDVLGGLEREIRLEIDPDRLTAYNFSLTELLTLIPSENRNISAGGLETPGTKFNVRVPAEFDQPEEIDNLLLAIRDGKPIYLNELATIRDTFKDRVGYARLDGVESISLSIQKRVGANIVAIAGTVKAILDEARKQAPKGVKFQTTLDRSEDIVRMVGDLENNILSGLILVVGVLMLFLGFRTSLIVAMAIPLSMLMSFAAIQALGYTLNMIVLFSLILALGMLVDNAIVIVENIYRHMQLGAGRVEAAMKGASEVAWPVITSTATTLAAFSPMLFWPGIIGDFMKYLPIVLIITLSSSLFVALLINPVICSVFGKAAPRKAEAEHGFIRGYRAVLAASLNHRFTTLSLAVLLLAGVAAYYGKHGAGVEFFPQSDPRMAIIDIRSPQGTNLKESDRLASLVEKRIGKYMPGDIEHVVTNVGSSGGKGALFGGGSGGPHVANLTLMFHDYDIRKRPTADVVAEIRKDVADIAGAEIKVEKEKEGPPTGAAVTVRIIGEDFSALERIGEQAKQLIVGTPGLVNLRSDLEATRPELSFQPSRRRAMLQGVNTTVIGNFLKTAIFGWKVGTYRQFNDEYDITVRLPESYRTSLDDLFRLRVPNAAGKAVPLSSVGEFSYKPGFGEIHRVNQKRVVTLTGDAEGRLSTAVLADVQDRLGPMGRPLLKAGDILDWPSFCRAMASPAGATPSVASRLFDRLPRPIQEAVRETAGSGQAAPDQQNRICEAINHALADRELFHREALAGRDIPKTAGGLLAKSPKKLSDGERAYLNRLALIAESPKLVAPIAKLDLPPGYEIRYVGEKEEQDKASAFLTRAFVIALLLIVGILVAQFNTLTVPIVIMTTVVLSLIGVLAGLLIHSMPFGIIMTGIGVISLAGVVVNNAIVLLDYTRLLQRRGLDLIEASIEAGVTRLRPVLLTAVTTMLGLIPMACGISFDFRKFQWAMKSESSEWWRGMAIAVIYGLGFATLLTLVVVPTLYVILYRQVAKLGLGGISKAGDELAGKPNTEA